MARRVVKEGVVGAFQGHFHLYGIDAEQRLKTLYASGIPGKRRASIECGNQGTTGIRCGAVRLPRGCPPVARPLKWGSRVAVGKEWKRGVQVAAGRTCV